MVSIDILRKERNYKVFGISITPIQLIIQPRKQPRTLLIFDMEEDIFLEMKASISLIVCHVLQPSPSPVYPKEKPFFVEMLWKIKNLKMSELKDNKSIIVQKT